jgi:hypothetical protein
MQALCSSESWFLPTSPHGVTTQRNNIDISISVNIIIYVYSVYSPLNLNCFHVHFRTTYWKLCVYVDLHMHPTRQYIRLPSRSK